MTQKEKELLLCDLCARLPYGIKAEIKYYDGVYKLQAIYTDGTTYVTRDVGNPIETYFEDCKPFLFPMSSMTKEQIKEFNGITQRCNTYTGKATLLTDFCNKHHIDIRGLINIGLALDATGLKIY